MNLIKLTPLAFLLLSGACAVDADLGSSQSEISSVQDIAQAVILVDKTAIANVQCLDVYDPVCGTNGVTYSNGCEAGRAGVGVAFFGTCDGDGTDNRGDLAGPLGTPIDPIDLTQTHRKPRPDDFQCLDVYAPVCGVNGVTYSNGCQAGLAGVAVDYNGACDGGDITNEITGSGRPDVSGAISLIDNSGLANVHCLDVWAPVCGENGVTYSNGCYAARAGVAVDFNGSCEGDSDQ